MAKVILIGGIPGCGKTTFAKNLFLSFRNFRDVVVLDFDTYESIDDFISDLKKNLSAKFIILEGTHSLLFDELRKLAHLKIFLQCDSDVALSRILLRPDGRDLNIGALLQEYEAEIQPQNEAIIYHSHRHADIIVPVNERIDKNNIIFKMITNYFTH